MDVFKARAKGLSDGLEPELSVVVDVMFPLEQLTCAVVAFQAEFPATPLRLYVEALGAVLQPVLEGRCAFGVTGSPHRSRSAHPGAPARRENAFSSRRPDILWRHSKARFQRVSLRNTGNSSSRTVLNCRREKTSASFPRIPGGSPIWVRSTPSCAQAWGGADAGGRNRNRFGKWIVGENSDRGCTQRQPCHGDVGGVPNRGSAWPGGALAD